MSDDVTLNITLTELREHARKAVGDAYNLGYRDGTRTVEQVEARRAELEADNERLLAHVNSLEARLDLAEDTIRRHTSPMAMR
jgi:cytochrome c556